MGEVSDEAIIDVDLRRLEKTIGAYHKFVLLAIDQQVEVLLALERERIGV